MLKSYIVSLFSSSIQHKAVGFTYDNPALNAKALISCLISSTHECIPIPSYSAEWQYNTMFKKRNLRQTVLKGN